MLISKQVHVPWAIFQLLLQGSILGTKGRCKPDCVCAYIQHLLLRNVIDTRRWYFSQSLGAHQGYGPYQRFQFSEAVACCDCFQLHLRPTSVSCPFCRSAVLVTGFSHIANVWAGFVAIGWQSYLSWLNQRAVNAERNREDLTVSTKATRSNKC